MATQHNPKRPLLFSRQVRAELGGIGNTTLWRYVKLGLLPRPHHLRTRAFWFADEIESAKRRLFQAPAGAQP